MLEALIGWLRSLFAPFKVGNRLENLNSAVISDKIRLLDQEKEQVIRRAEKLKADRERLRLEARDQDDLRRRELARQIVGLDEEISDKGEQLDHIYQQRKMLRQLIRYSERMDRMREYGLEKIFGPRVDLAAIEKEIIDATMGGSLDMDRLTRVTSTIDSALAYGRATVTDESVLSILAEITRDEETERALEGLNRSSAGVRTADEPAVARILEELAEDSSGRRLKPTQGASRSAESAVQREHDG
jgi:hypothetical protein